MEGLRILNIIMFVLLIGILGIEIYVLSSESSNFLIQRFVNPITIPLYISFILFGYNSFIKKNKNLNVLSAIAFTIFIAYLIISWR